MREWAASTRMAPTSLPLMFPERHAMASRRRASAPCCPPQLTRNVTQPAPPLAWQVEEALRRIGEDHRRVLLETHFRARPYAEVAEEVIDVDDLGPADVAALIIGVRHGAVGRADR